MFSQSFESIINIFDASPGFFKAAKVKKCVLTTKFKIA